MRRYLGMVLRGDGPGRAFPRRKLLRQVPRLHAKEQRGWRNRKGPGQCSRIEPWRCRGRAHQIGHTCSHAYIFGGAPPPPRALACPCELRVLEELPKVQAFRLRMWALVVGGAWSAAR